MILVIEKPIRRVPDPSIVPVLAEGPILLYRHNEPGPVVQRLPRQMVNENNIPKAVPPQELLPILSKSFDYLGGGESTAKGNTPPEFSISSPSDSTGSEDVYHSTMEEINEQQIPTKWAVKHPAPVKFHTDSTNTDQTTMTTGKEKNMSYVDSFTGNSQDTANTIEATENPDAEDEYHSKMENINGEEVPTKWAVKSPALLQHSPTTNHTYVPSDNDESKDEFHHKFETIDGETVLTKWAVKNPAPVKYYKTANPELDAIINPADPESQTFLEQIVNEPADEYHHRFETIHGKTMLTKWAVKNPAPTKCRDQPMNSLLDNVVPDVKNSSQQTSDNNLNSIDQTFGNSDVHQSDTIVKKEAVDIPTPTEYQQVTPRFELGSDLSDSSPRNVDPMDQTGAVEGNTRLQNWGLKSPVPVQPLSIAKKLDKQSNIVEPIPTANILETLAQTAHPSDEIHHQFETIGDETVLTHWAVKNPAPVKYRDNVPANIDLAISLPKESSPNYLDLIDPSLGAFIDPVNDPSETVEGAKPTPGKFSKQEKREDTKSKAKPLSLRELISNRKAKLNSDKSINQVIINPQFDQQNGGVSEQSMNAPSTTNILIINRDKNGQVLDEKAEDANLGEASSKHNIEILPTNAQSIDNANGNIQTSQNEVHNSGTIVGNEQTDKHSVVINPTNAQNVENGSFNIQSGTNQETNSAIIKEDETEHSIDIGPMNDQSIQDGNSNIQSEGSESINSAVISEDDTNQEVKPPVPIIPPKDKNIDRHTVEINPQVSQNVDGKGNVQTQSSSMVNNVSITDKNLNSQVRHSIEINPTNAQNIDNANANIQSGTNIETNVADIKDAPKMKHTIEINPTNAQDIQDGNQNVQTGGSTSSNSAIISGKENNEESKSEIVPKRQTLLERLRAKYGGDKKNPAETEKRM